MSVLYGIWWKEESGNARLCALCENNYYEKAFVSLSKAESRATESNREAEYDGYPGNYYAAQIPQGITCHWIDDSM